MITKDVAVLFVIILHLFQSLGLGPVEEGWWGGPLSHNPSMNTG